MDQYIPNIFYWDGVYAVGLWVLLLWLVSQNSGWAALARQYSLPREQAEELEWTGWQSVRLDGFPYLRCIWTAATSEGLALKTGPDIFLRPAHPPLMLPWNDLEISRAPDGKFLVKIGDKKLLLPASMHSHALSALETQPA